eukprot:1159231-Pelagomonas_calceolata.AAC.1
MGAAQAAGCDSAARQHLHPAASCWHGANASEAPMQFARALQFLSTSVPCLYTSSCWSCTASCIICNSSCVLEMLGGVSNAFGGYAPT